MGTRIEHHPGCEVLPKRNIDADLRGLAQALIIRGLHNADNLVEERIARELKSLADGILIWPKSGGHRFVDDRYGNSSISVEGGEIPALAHADAERCEIVEIHGVDHGHHRICLLAMFFAFDSDAA